MQILKLHSYRWDNGANQLSFSRNGAAFIAFNYESGGTLSRDFQTGMPAGAYCDIINGEATDSGCTGHVINVDGNGNAFISIDASSEDPFVAIHIGRYYFLALLNHFKHPKLKQKKAE